MLTPRRAHALIALGAAFFCGCTPPPLPPAVVAPIATVAPATPIAPLPEFDPVAVGMSAEGVKRLCDDHLLAAQQLVDGVKKLKGSAPDKLTFEATLGRLDDLRLELSDAGDFPALMRDAHPDSAVRVAAKLCEPKVERFTTSLFLDEELFAVVRAYAEKKEPLTAERARLLADTLRDFRRNGLTLSLDDKAHLRALSAEITKLGEEFQANINASTGKVQVPASALAGLQKEYVASHPPNEHGLSTITTDYPDFFPFVTYSPDRKAAADLYILFTNRGGDSNVKLLERMLTLRSEEAKLLGYKSWAAYAIEPRMAKTPEVVHAFLERIRVALKEPAKAEYAELLDAHVKLGGHAADKLEPWDRVYLQAKVKKSKYSFDAQELTQYLEVGAVVKGLLEITSRMYGLTYEPIATKVWHPDVTAYDVRSGDESMGRLYLDLYSRQDKYKHAAMFTVRTAKRRADESFQLPIAALECNFPKPGAQAALMSHEDVVTFFHEFGHVLHHLLARSELATYAGTSTVRDFVEAPSQMFEEWPWSREVLDLFARHYETKEKIPDALFEAMQKARTFGRALETQRQLYLATLDQELHTRQPGFDSTKVVEEVQDATDMFGYVKGTHFQSSFGHLVSYDAGYYSYQWALALSRDALTRFRKEGLMNPATAASWRAEVLSKGGGADERGMIKSFLGREPNDDAYFAFIAGKQ